MGNATEFHARTTDGTPAELKTISDKISETIQIGGSVRSLLANLLYARAI